MILRSTNLRQTASFNGQIWKIRDTGTFYDIENKVKVASGVIIRLLESIEGCYAIIKKYENEEKQTIRIV